MPYKRGANKLDQNQIKLLMADGKKSDEISKILKIEEDIVKKFMKAYKSGAEAPKAGAGGAKKGEPK